MDKKKQQKGATSIFITLVIVTSILFVALTINSIVMNGIRMSRAHLDSAKAYFAAESGTEHILWIIRQSQASGVALDPAVQTPPWTTGNCVWLDGSSCNTDCLTNIPGQVVKIEGELTNDSKYRIKYLDTSAFPISSASFQTTGIYNNATRRVVQVEYIF
jgi:hypothetical protein